MRHIEVEPEYSPGSGYHADDRHKEQGFVRPLKSHAKTPTRASVAEEHNRRQESCEASANSRHQHDAKNQFPDHHHPGEEIWVVQHDISKERLKPLESISVIDCMVYERNELILAPRDPTPF